MPEFRPESDGCEIFPQTNRHSLPPQVWCSERLMSSDTLIHLIAAEAEERETLSRYLRRHDYNIEVFDSLDASKEALAGSPPSLIVLAGSSIPSPDICKFGAAVEMASDSPIIALLTKLQMSIVSELAESENLWTAEYPISLREIRASIVEAFEEISAG